MKKMKITSKSDEYLAELATSLVNRQINKNALTFSLKDIQRMYVILTQMLENHPPQISIVSIGENVYFQFSEISPQHFLIEDSNGLSENDFAFIPNKNWFGPQEQSKGVIQFFREELSSNWWLIIVLFLLFIIMLFTHDNDLYIKISELVLQATTVFLSIYLIFTVSQNQIIATDKKLFIQGIVYKFYSDDRYLAIEAIFTIVLSLSNTILVHFLVSLQFTYFLFRPDFLLVKDYILALTSSFLVILMVDTFLSVTNYFFFRTKHILDRNMASDILHDEFQKYEKHDS